MVTEAAMITMILWNRNCNYISAAQFQNVLSTFQKILSNSLIIALQEYQFQITAEASLTAVLMV